MPQILIGTILEGPGEPIVIEKFEGRGGFGEVFKASGQMSGKKFAVKTLQAGEMSNLNALQALMNEIKMAQQIDHPNVVRLLSASDGQTPYGPYLVSEFVSGGTLEDKLALQRDSKTDIELDVALAMMVQVAEGLQAINEKLIHRDIKPDNVFVDGAELKIGDFGISKLIAESTRLSTFKGIGHLSYMAPEGWRYETNTPKIDTYSAGLVFYEILTLKHPLRQFVTDTWDQQQWRRVHLFQSCPDVRTLRKTVPSYVAQLLSRTSWELWRYCGLEDRHNYCVWHREGETRTRILPKSAFTCISLYLL